MISDPIALAAIIAGITALGFWLDRRYDWAAKVGAGLLIIGIGAVVSNLGLVPLTSPVYAAVTGPVTSLAIVWLLFAVDLRDLKAAGPLMLAAFGIAVAATAIGAITATLVFHRGLGHNAWKLAGAMTGTYSGGSLNFVAVGRALGIPAETFAAANASDAVMTAIWMGATIVLPLWIGKYYPRPVPQHVIDDRTAQPRGVNPGSSATRIADRGSRIADRETPVTRAAKTSPDAANTDRAANPAGARDAAAQAPSTGYATERATDAANVAPIADDRDPRSAIRDQEPPQAAPQEHPFFAEVPLRILDISILFTLAFALILAANGMARLVPSVPSVLWLTTFALIVGHVPAVANLKGAMQLGTLALHMFFAIIGIYSRIAEMLKVGPDVFLFTATVVLIHGALTYLGGRAARVDVGTTSVASQAAVGGPASAVALAVARDWPALVLPGIVAGLLGYAAGNYVAFGVAYLLRAIVGG
ncbi:MAG: DUF819 family protein [Gemmatimonadota bacterium]